MGDPWKCIDQAGDPCSALNAESQSFDDNFDSVVQDFDQNTANLDTNKSKSFEPLPDSSAYLATLGIKVANISICKRLKVFVLEKKLSKLTAKSTVHSSAERRDLLLSLSGAREGHIDRLLTLELGEQVTLDGDIDLALEETITTTVIRHVAPHLQAVSAGELVHLLKADHLEQASITEEIEANLSTIDQVINKEQ